jgi:periplasmic divalent cation tolerance protein
MSEEVFVVLTTWPDAAVARKAARVLVEAKIVACANLLPGVESIYRWVDAVETAAEVLVIFKMATHRYPEFERRLPALHPYDVPEIVALRVAEGLPAYLRWVEESCVTTAR